MAQALWARYGTNLWVGSWISDFFTRLDYFNRWPRNWTWVLFLGESYLPHFLSVSFCDFYLCFITVYFISFTSLIILCSSSVCMFSKGFSHILIDSQRLLCSKYIVFLKFRTQQPLTIYENQYATNQIWDFSLFCQLTDHCLFTLIVGSHRQCKGLDVLLFL